MINKFVVLMCLLAGIALGAVFIYFPIKNTAYSGPNQTTGICDGSQVLVTYTAGSVRRGIPIVNKNTVVLSPACGSHTTFSNNDWDIDFAVGLAAGFGLTYSIYHITRPHKKSAKSAKKTRKSKK